MRPFRIRNDVQRVVVNGFALPLGIAPPPGRLNPPEQGFTLSFVQGEDEPDTYSFHVVVSHERVAAVLKRAMEFLPDELYAIVEIGSRDAYRSTDTFISDEPIHKEDFLATWREFESFLLEDSAIAAGANSEEPFVEVFMDQWKGVAIHVPPELRDDVERALQELGLEEVMQTWAEPPDQQSGGDLIDDDETDRTFARPVLEVQDEFSPDIDEILLELRHRWRLELNIDPESNIDEAGRNLGSTLWHAVVIVDRADARTASATANGESAERSAYASIWATAGSLREMEELIQQVMDQQTAWSVSDIYTIDRVAFDERPDELADLRPSQRESRVHLVSIEEWGEQSPGDS